MQTLASGTPFFSILMASYNNGPYLKQAIDSVLAQTTELPWELVFVDDASTDESVALAESYRDERVRIYRHTENRGTGYTKWHCANLALGQWLVFFDPDDVLVPEALHVFAQSIAQHPHAVMHYPSHYRCGPNLENPQLASFPAPLPPGQSHLTHRKHGISLLALFSAKAYQTTEGINPQLKRAVDQDLNVKMEETGACVYIPKPLQYYRIHAGGISNNQNELKARFWALLVAEAAFERRQATSIPNLSRAELDELWERLHMEWADRKAKDAQWSAMYFHLCKAMQKLPLKRVRLRLQYALAPLKSRK